MMANLGLMTSHGGGSYQFFVISLCSLIDRSLVITNVLS